MLTIILSKILNFESNFLICQQSCCQKINETSIALVWSVHNKVQKNDRHFHHTFVCFYRNILKKRQTLASHTLMCSQQCNGKIATLDASFAALTRMLWKKDRHLHLTFVCSQQCWEKISTRWSNFLMRSQHWIRRQRNYGKDKIYI